MSRKQVDARNSGPSSEPQDAPETAPGRLEVRNLTDIDLDVHASWTEGDVVVTIRKPAPRGGAE